MTATTNGRRASWRRLAAALALAGIGLLGLPARHVSGQQMAPTGAFVWFDLVTTDAAAARTFYGSLFGWTFRDSERDGRPYAVAQAGARPVGGIVTLDRTPDAGPQWVSYVIVTDVDGATGEARSAGARILVEPRDVPAGRVAVIADPQGAPIGLGQGDLPPVSVADARVGEFLWVDYLTHDGEGALRFYDRVIGYAIEPAQAPQPGLHLIFRRNGPRAGLFVLPERVQSVRSHWLPHVRVDDPARAAEEAVRLGGTVLLAPGPDVRGGTLVIVADPTGAAIALQKWPLQ